ncbi:MAG: isochorismatase family protein [Calditrichaeota bacterium]|nr:isochorismatase family protein [Calditrichota bacterium]
MELKGEYYRHYPVDFSQGKLGARGFLGWGETVPIVVPVAETALVAMHIWNVGFDPELPFAPQGPAGPVMEMLEWAARSVPITREVIPPLLAAARAAGVRVIHVASDESYARRYPGYHRTVALAGPEPTGLPTARGPQEEPYPDSDKSRLLFGPRFPEAAKWYGERLDFPEVAKPHDDEYVALTTHQLNAVLRELGIWQLIYVGFAIDWCLWFSPGGMVDMSRLGYRCSCIKEAVTAVENKESVQDELHKQEALWRTSLMFGYVHSAADFIAACNRVAPREAGKEG